jgi:hypothetical protein
MSDPSLHPFARDLVASSKEDSAPERGAERMLLALGISAVALTGAAAASAGSAAPIATAAGTGAGAATANAAAGTVAAHGVVTTAVLAKWVTIAALAGVAAGATGYHVAQEYRGDGHPTASVGAPPIPPWVAPTSPPPSPPVPPPVARPRDTAPPSVAAPPAPRPIALAAAPAPAPAPAAPSSSSSEAPDEALAREMSQVTYARSLVEQRRYADALQAISAYRASLGKVLEPEIRALEVEATLGLGRVADGKKLAQSFLDDYPRHPAASRVRGLIRPLD